MAADIPGNASSSAGKAAFTVVITRPSGQSTELIERLSVAGMATLEFPLIDIAPVADDAPLRAALASLERYALVIFVSPNAIDHAFAKSDAIWPHALPVGVVGPGSVQALARHGVSAPAHRVISPASGADDDNGRFDSEGLFAAIESALGEANLEGKRVLIVRGDGGREWLADHAIPTIDYCDVHSYPRDDHDSFVDSPAALKEFIENRAAAAFSIRKPLVFGEFGMGVEGYNSASQAEWYKAFFEGNVRAGAGGAMGRGWFPPGAFCATCRGAGSMSPL